MVSNLYFSCAILLNAIADEKKIIFTNKNKTLTTQFTVFSTFVLWVAYWQLLLLCIYWGVCSHPKKQQTFNNAQA